jgi:serpin B
VVTGLLAQSSINDTQIVIANAIWAMKQKVLKDYATAMWQLYKAPVRTVNSTDPINIWARNKTNGRIQDVAPTGTKFNVLITNAVYFKGRWEYAFDPQDTLPQPFQTYHNGTQKAVEVPMMYQKFTARDMTADRQVFYANISGRFRAVQLPYRNNNISAVALLPDKARYGLDVDAAAVDLAELGLLSTARWKTMYQAGQLNLQLPKFTVQTNRIPFKKALQALNVTTSFNEEKANFSRISTEPIYISDVLQSTFIQVDEVGTEAAAVTTAVMVTTAYNPAVVDLVFDRPFIFVVMDVVSGVVLFQGTVKDPSRL